MEAMEEAGVVGAGGAGVVAGAGRIGRVRGTEARVAAEVGVAARVGVSEAVETGVAREEDLVFIIVEEER